MNSPRTSPASAAAHRPASAPPRLVYTPGHRPGQLARRRPTNLAAGTEVMYRAGRSSEALRKRPDIGLSVLVRAVDDLGGLGYLVSAHDLSVEAA